MDVVYVVKQGDHNEELRYSLRSLSNVPHGQVWIAGYKPRWVVNVGHLATINGAGSKYQNSTRNLITAASHADVSNRFLFFNDDFFVLKPVACIPVLHRGPVSQVIDHYNGRYGRRPGPYLEGMQATSRLLAEWGFTDPLSYELHVPIEIDKRLLLDVMREAIGRNIKALHKRTLYGNVAGLGGTQIEDVKALTYNDRPADDATFFSTSDKTFRGGMPGQTIRKLFRTPSPYERS